MNLHVFVWLPLFAAEAHIFEEFAFPGGFKAWYKRCRPSDPTITTRRLVIANSILLFFCLCAGLFGPNRYGVQVWLIVMGSLFANSIFHVLTTVRMREYSPGVISSLLIYFPLAIVGAFHLVNLGMTTLAKAGAFLLFGMAIMLYIDLKHFIARALHPHADTEGAGAA